MQKVDLLNERSGCRNLAFVLAFILRLLYSDSVTSRHLSLVTGKIDVLVSFLFALQAYKVPQFDKRLAREIEFRGGEGTIDQTSYVAPEALRRMMKRFQHANVLFS